MPERHSMNRKVHESFSSGQTARMSALESITNVFIGFILAVFIQIKLFSSFGIEVETNQEVAIALLFTAASIVRSFVVRRVFNSIARKR